MKVMSMVQSRLKVIIEEHNLKRRREGKPPLTIRDVAEETGLASSTITGLTAHRSTQVSFHTIGALCRYFGVTPGDLFIYSPEGDD